MSPRPPRNVSSFFCLWFYIFSSAQSYYFYPDPPLLALPVDEQAGRDRRGKNGRANVARLAGDRGGGGGAAGEQGEIFVLPPLRLRLLSQSPPSQQQKREVSAGWKSGTRGGVQRAAAAGRGWRRTSGEKRGDGLPRKVSSFFVNGFYFFFSSIILFVSRPPSRPMHLRRPLCRRLQQQASSAGSPAATAGSAVTLRDGELGRLSGGRRSPRRRAQENSSASGARSSSAGAFFAGSTIDVIIPPRNVSSFFCLWFLYFFFSSIILFFPSTELRASLASDTSALNESAGASLAVVSQRHDLSGFILEVDPEEMGVAERTQP